MFIVPKKDGGWRPIINLKRLNSYLEVPHFKMEGIRDLKDILQMGDYMGKLDLKDAYLTVPVKESHRDFLKFQWKDQSYRFCSLPFGLATAPRVFTKILRPLAAKLRKQGIQILFYLDDLLVLAQSQQMLDQHIQLLAHELTSLGFKLNHKKCVWIPTQRLDFLGFQIDSIQMKLYLPSEKVEKITKECRHFVNKSEVSARDFAHLIGLLSSTIPTIEVAPLHYRTSSPHSDKGRRELRSSRNPQSGLSRRSAVVDTKSYTLERASSCPPISRHDNIYRCLENRMGCHRPTDQHQRSVDKVRKTGTYQCFRDEGSSTGSPSPCTFRKENPHSITHRQFNNHCVPQSQRGHTFENPVCTSGGNLDMVLRERSQYMPSTSQESTTRWQMPSQGCNWSPATGD